jgi:hypothetical protein
MCDFWNSKNILVVKMNAMDIHPLPLLSPLSFPSSTSHPLPIPARNLATSALSAATSLRSPACAARKAAASSRVGGVEGVSHGGVSVSIRCCAGGEGGRRSVECGVKNSWVGEGERGDGEE